VGFTRKKMVAQIAVPRILRIGSGAFAETREVLQILGLQNPLIVTDPYIRKRGLARLLADSVSVLGHLRSKPDSIF
jgi:alcohol dehydrogenase class IV